MVRARTIDELAEVRPRVDRCFEAGALATGARLDIADISPAYAHMKHDADLVALYRANAERLGRTIDDDVQMTFSTDMGNLSLAMPSIHPCIALDSGGAATAGQWIRGAKATYPCLIDECHVTAELYGVVNVPQAVWIDEAGRIVRPTETAGSSDAFRRELDRATKQMSARGMAERERVRGAYVDALRNWAVTGTASPYALPEAAVRRRLPLSSEEHALAAANFRLGQYLHARGHAQAAAPYLAEARRLHPESWSYRRQTWELEEPGKAGGAEFWAAVDALGERPYYSPTVLEA